MANERDDQEEAARRSREAGIADESAALQPGGDDPVPTEDKPEDTESAGHPS